MKDFSIANGWLNMPTEEALEKYLMWLRKNKFDNALEIVEFENFASNVMEMYYQLKRCKRALTEGNHK